jgi:CHASE2 domain-containing sensor protein
MIFPGLVGQALLAGSVAMAAASGKQAFDAVVQRDAPDANRGRSFARFESRFQVIWVLGAAVPVLIAMPTRIGGAIVMAVAAAAATLFSYSLRAIRQGQAPPRLPTAKGLTQTVRQARKPKNPSQS